MAQRMSTFLRKVRQSADYNPQTWAWVKGKQRPVKTYRFIKRGKKVGWVEIELFYPEGKTIIVPVTSVKFPDTTTSQEIHKKNGKSAK